MKPKKRDHAGHAINTVASYLSTTAGFIATFITLMVGVGIGAALQFDNAFMFTFNIILSVAAIVISGIILVSGARSEAALHVKLDYLIAFSNASNKAVGIEHMDTREIEAERQRIETDALRQFSEVVEDVIEDEVEEQLGRRDRESSNP